MLYDSLQNENNESFNFGYLNGVRGFFTNPSRADDSFVPFKSGVSIKTSSFSANDYIDIKTNVTSIVGTVTLSKTSSVTPTCAIYALNENGTIGNELYTANSSGTKDINLSSLNAPYGVRLAHTKADTSTNSVFDVTL